MLVQTVEAKKKKSTLIQHWLVFKQMSYQRIWCLMFHLIFVSKGEVVFIMPLSTHHHAHGTCVCFARKYSQKYCLNGVMYSVLAEQCKIYLKKKQKKHFFQSTYTFDGGFVQQCIIKLLKYDYPFLLLQSGFVRENYKSNKLRRSSLTWLLFCFNFSVKCYW